MLVRLQRATCSHHVPRETVTAMWKAQLLSGMQPPQLSGNTVVFPSVIKFVLTSKVICLLMPITNLPKFVTGEALEVVKRNRGC